MYYEEAIVREYRRKDGRNNKQLNLGVNSKYKKDDEVIIIKSDKIQTFKENLEPQTKQLKENVEGLETENQKLKTELEAIKTELQNLKNEKETIIETANKNVLEATQQVLEKEKEINEINKNHAKELAALNKELNNEKDTSKTLLLAVYSYEERGIINGLFNRTPTLAKQILKENPKPIETNKKE